LTSIPGGVLRRAVDLKKRLARLASHLPFLQIGGVIIG